MSVNRKKLTVSKSESIKFEVNYETIKSIKDQLNSLSEKYGEDARIDVEYNEFYGFEWDIVYSREETDEEYNKRIKEEEKKDQEIKKAKKNSKGMKEEKELKEYERLKKKFGDKKHGKFNTKWH